ncbi:NDP-hexose 2,3-dehydratase family protein [Nocardiopsis quinghaiensis]|uniref:NDP-hexose 2,3-dehydratase family protein n=1 Tax=Nocardiopsis quinghaiensis TaxID=464995 RepID=UPI00123AF142|nr:NDP-hexose 2,3-dehydratase family protein [Nocardiopsis quinghaiensis]
MTTAAKPGRPVSDEEFRSWLADQHTARAVSVERVPFSEARGWSFEEETGNLRHRSGGFFTVEGVEVRDGADTWTQPIIDQPEIGILGVLTADFDGVPHFLMQAKFEPGNVNVLQMSPTVQATRSNFTRVHGGRNTPYVEYFNGSRPRRTLVDVLQSEQGQWFWRKRNRNMVVRVDGDVPVHEGFCWLSLDQVLRFLRTDNLLNMDARTVLACMRLDPPSPVGGPFREALAASYSALSPTSPRPALHGPGEITSHLIEAKSRCAWVPRLVPLDRVKGWSRGADEVADDGGREFRVIAVRVKADTREVSHWTQPLLAPRGHGLAVFLARRIRGVLHFLVRALPQPGLMDVVELAPTVQVTPSSASRESSAAPHLGEAPTGDGERVLYDALLSEEGGRFHHAQTRYRIVEAAADGSTEEPEGCLWVTLGQLMELLEHGHYLNIEARTLVACAHSLRAVPETAAGA